MPNEAKPIQQIPLDRVTQALYAKIYAEMEPVRRALSETVTVSHEFASVLAQFCAALPPLKLSAYAQMQEDLTVLADLFERAVKVPLSEATRMLAIQIVAHDLPRVAAIATKLNEEDAPKFFAAISKKEPDAALRYFSTPDVQSKTQIRRADFETVLATVVNARFEEAARMVREDMAQWLTSQGADGPHVELIEDERNEYVFRKSGKVWEVIFDGGPPFHIQDGLGARYLNWLLHNPNTPISSFDLEKEITPEKANARARGALDYALDGDAIRDYLRRLEKLRAERDEARGNGDDATVRRLEAEIDTIEAELRKQGRSRDAGERARDNVRKAIATVKQQLKKGERHEKDFLKHIEDLVSTGYDCQYKQPKGYIWR